VKNILNVEDEVAKAVANEIPVRLTSKQQAELVQSRPVNPEAFDAYMQASYFFERNTSKDSDMAAKYYERATHLDRTRHWRSCNFHRASSYYARLIRAVQVCE
jgi:hypothetical protein